MPQEDRQASTWSVLAMLHVGVPTRPEIEELIRDRGSARVN
jgi:hypothetical protein